MAILKGRGYAAVNYPTGMNLGGDPTQALAQRDRLATGALAGLTRQCCGGHAPTMLGQRG